MEHNNAMMAMWLTEMDAMQIVQLVIITAAQPQLLILTQTLATAPVLALMDISLIRQPLFVFPVSTLVELASMQPHATAV